jgi:hypothetical protein
MQEQAFGFCEGPDHHRQPAASHRPGPDRLLLSAVPSAVPAANAEQTLPKAYPRHAIRHLIALRVSSPRRSDLNLGIHGADPAFESQIWVPGGMPSPQRQVCFAAAACAFDRAQSIRTISVHSLCVVLYSCSDRWPVGQPAAVSLLQPLLLTAAQFNLSFPLPQGPNAPRTTIRLPRSRLLHHREGGAIWCKGAHCWRR